MIQRDWLSAYQSLHLFQSMKEYYSIYHLLLLYGHLLGMICLNIFCLLYPEVIPEYSARKDISI